MNRRGGGLVEHRDLEDKASVVCRLFVCLFLCLSFCISKRNVHPRHSSRGTTLPLWGQ